MPTGLKDDTLRSPSTAGQTRLIETQSHGPNSIRISSPLGATDGSTAPSFEIVPAVASFEIMARDPRLPCFSLGALKKMDQFCGREDVLKIIDDFLLPSSKSAELNHSEQLHSFAICGLGGMGKTEVAVEYAYTRREYFDAIFWLSADNANILAGSFAQIAQELGLEDASKAQDLTASHGLVHGWLSQPLRKAAGPDSPENEVHWLLIFDNVDNLDVLSDYWPKTGRGSVLVTSRDPLAKNNLYTDDGIDIPPLTNEESEALMQSLTHMKADASQRAALSAIADKLGGLPLAISQMASVIRRLRMSYNAFLKFYETEGIEQLQKKQSTSTDSEKARSLATVWALDSLSPQTMGLLQVICLLDPDNIPEEILVENCGDVELSGYPKSRGDYYDARAELLQSSLINQNAEQEQLSLHRLIQETTKAMMGESRLFEVFQAALSLVALTWPFQSMKEHHSIARFGKCGAVFPSVLRLKNGLEPLIRGPSNFPLDIRMAQLFNDTGW